MGATEEEDLSSSPPADNYVHRLVQNKGDGKLVEVVSGQGLPSEEKIDSLQLEVWWNAHTSMAASSGLAAVLLFADQSARVAASLF